MKNKNISGSKRLEFSVQLKGHCGHGKSLVKNEERDFKNIWMVVISALQQLGYSGSLFGKKIMNFLINYWPSMF